MFNRSTYLMNPNINDIQDKLLCGGWNSGNAIQGLVDATSTYFDIVDDPVLLTPRNFGLQWIATNEGWEFIPDTSATSYIINSISYVPIIAGATTWTDANGTVLGTGPTLPVNVAEPSPIAAALTVGAEEYPAPKS